MAQNNLSSRITIQQKASILGGHRLHLANETNAHHARIGDNSSSIKVSMCVAGGKQNTVTGRELHGNYTFAAVGKVTAMMMEKAP